MQQHHWPDERAAVGYVVKRGFTGNECGDEWQLWRTRQLALTSELILTQFSASTKHRNRAQINFMETWQKTTQTVDTFC